jgi:hypothetical protein
MVGLIKYILLFLTFFSYGQEHILIGDSQTFYLSKYVKTIKLVKSLSQSGIGIDKLNEKLISYPISSNVSSVSVCIGVNDCYKDKGVKKLMSIIKKTFPNAIIYIIQGSWGWGGVKNSNIFVVSKYYKKFQDLGGIIIETPIGYGDPHCKKESYKVIVKTIEGLIKKE